jgi:hypothetical protein
MPLRHPAARKRVTVAGAHEDRPADTHAWPLALPRTSRFRTHDDEGGETSGRHGGQPRHQPFDADASEEPA